MMGALLISMHGRGAPEAITAVAVLATGAFFLVAGLARAGGLASFISRPVLRGFSFKSSFLGTSSFAAAVASSP